MSPSQLVELRAERARFSRERSSLEELLATGEYAGPYPLGSVRAVQLAVMHIKRARERKGQTLTAVARLSMLGKATLSRLESGKTVNPTFATLWSYASAVGVELELTPRESATQP